MEVINQPRFNRWYRKDSVLTEAFYSSSLSVYRSFYVVVVT